MHLCMQMSFYMNVRNNAILIRTITNFGSRRHQENNLNRRALLTFVTATVKNRKHKQCKSAGVSTQKRRAHFVGGPGISFAVRNLRVSCS